MAKGRRKKYNFFDGVIGLIILICLAWYALPYVLIIGLVIVVIKILICAIINAILKRKGIKNTSNDNSYTVISNNDSQSKIYDVNDSNDNDLDDKIDKKEEEFNRQADYFGLSKGERESCKLENMSPEEYVEAEEDDDYLSDKW